MLTLIFTDERLIFPILFYSQKGKFVPLQVYKIYNLI